MFELILVCICGIGIGIIGIIIEKIEKGD